MGGGGSARNVQGASRRVGAASRRVSVRGAHPDHLSAVLQ